MRYLPKSPADRETMLREIGVHSVDDFFKAIPAEYRLNRDLNVPRQMAESEIVDWFRERSRENWSSEPETTPTQCQPPARRTSVHLTREIVMEMHQVR